MKSENLGFKVISADTSAGTKSYLLASQRPVLNPIPYGPLNIRCPPQNTIFYQGDAADTFFVIKSGWIKQYLLLEDGRCHILDFATSGDIIGINATPNGCHYSTAETITDVVLSAHSCELLSKHGTINQSADLLPVVRHLSRESRRMHKRIVAMSTLPASDRILHLLTDIFLRARKCLPVTGDILPLPLNQQMIAEAVGLTSVHVSRTMTLLRLNGVIEFRSGLLTIVDAEAMLSMSYVDPADYRDLHHGSTDRIAAF
jgi:CRP-like cAMP-binding protein|tara:strand:- start:3377 stop:4150 length:774 start_codon:yes stop_codon:yes gene_type:complete